jgi:co-chaperonin GroES (HSP10)
VIVAERIKPLGDRVLLHKCVNEEPTDDAGNVLIVLPDMTRDNTNFCQVVASGPKCKVPWPEGAIVRVKVDYHQDLSEVPDSMGAFWLAREELVEPVVYG